MRINIIRKDDGNPVYTVTVSWPDDFPWTEEFVAAVRRGGFGVEVWQTKEVEIMKEMERENNPGTN